MTSPAATESPIEKASPPQARTMHLPAMSDAEIVDLVGMVREEKTRVLDTLGDLERAALSELEARIRERRKTNPDARAIPHPRFEVELIEEFAPYQFDLAKLRAAVPMLPEDEGAKIITHVAEHVEIIAAHDEPGNISTIKALAKKYAGTTIGDVLSSAFSRDKTGDKLVCKPRKSGAA